MLFSPHHGDLKQALLMLDLGIMIKAEGANPASSPSAISRPSTIIEGDLTGLFTLPSTVQRMHNKTHASPLGAPQHSS